MPTPVDCYTTLSRAELPEILKEIILWLLQEISPGVVVAGLFMSFSLFAQKEDQNAYNR